jgi:hypothetical protein
MIAELLKYADAIGLTGHEPLRKRPLHWLIDLDDDGNVLSISPTVGELDKKGQNKRGKHFSMPGKYILGSHNQSDSVAYFLSGTPKEIFLKTDKPKIQSFQKILAEAKRYFSNANKIIHAITLFIEKNHELSDIECIREEIEKQTCKIEDLEKETFSFRVAGEIAFKNREIKKWWNEIAQRNLIKKELIYRKMADDRDFDEYGNLLLDTKTIVITSSPSVNLGKPPQPSIPFVSFNSAPFCSYGLGTQTATLSLGDVEKAAAALNALLQDEHHRFYLGEQVAVFWAWNKSDNKTVDCNFINLLQSADTLAISDFIKSIWGARPAGLNAAAFTLVLLEKGTGRFSVKSVENDTLQNVVAKVTAFFRTIAMPGSECVTLPQMAESTVAPKSKTKPSGHVYASLLGAATKGKKLEFNIVAAAIRRQAIEFAKGADDKDKGAFVKRAAARVALLKLYFQLNKEISMNETNHEKQEHPAYLCGRVLALFDKIHNIAHGWETGSSPAYRYYGAASSTPALVFHRLRKLTAIHLEKIDGGLAYKLQHGVPKERAEPPLAEDFDGLDQIIARFGKDGKWPRTLSLEDQGRFAIGFHYEKARKWPKYRKNANPGGDDSDAVNTIA